MGRWVWLQACESCAQLFPARQIVGGRDARPAMRVRAIPGRDEWFFRTLSALLALLSPHRAPLIARTGVAIFGVSLLFPMLVSSVVAPPSDVVVAATTELQRSAAYEMPPQPDPIARPRPATMQPTPTPEAPPRPTPFAAAPIAITAVPAAASGSVVTVSWYGPGFYENRLPCWQWLAANGLPIQFLPDTWGVAHKSLPCGTMVTLTHGANTATVPVVDRGPYIAGREFDLSPQVKAALGCADLCTVVMQIR